MKLSGIYKKYFRQKFKNSRFDEFVRHTLVPKFFSYYLKFVHLTSKIIVINEKYYEKIKNERIVFATWHGRQFSCVLKHQNQNITVMVSPSRDGSVQAYFIKNLGYKSIRGSSDKNPVKSLLKMIKNAKKYNDNFAFAVDGPKGPVYEVKPGIIKFAEKTGYYILPMSSDAKYKIQLKTWDKCLIPLPFNKIVIMYAKPFKIGKSEDISENKNKCETRMKDLLNLMRRYI